jgi:hypothetical protein
MADDFSFAKNLSKNAVSSPRLRYPEQTKVDKPCMGVIAKA